MQSIRNFLNDMDQRKWARDVKNHTERKERVAALTLAQSKTNNPAIKEGYQKLINMNLEWIEKIESEYPHIKF